MHAATQTHTLRLALERGCAGSVNLQLSVFGVSALAWGSGISREPPPDDGKIPSERGRSFLRRQEGLEKWYFDCLGFFLCFLKAEPCNV